MRIALRLSMLLTFVVLLSTAKPAAAHGYIVRSIPEDRAVLERAPGRVQYWFSEDLEPAFSSIALRSPTGEILASGSMDETNRTLLSLRVPPGLPDGPYIVDLRPAFASDGHVSAASRVFFVGAAVEGVTGGFRYEVMPLEIVWRTLLLASVMLLTGVFVLYAYVLVPAWGSPQHPVGLLPPRVMRRLSIMIIVALVGALAGNMLALVQQSMAFFNTGIAEVLSQGLWSVVRSGSRLGDVWNWRMLLLALAAALFAASLYLREQQPELLRPFWTANAWLMPLMIATFSVTSHAAGSPLWPWTGIFVDWMHGLGVALWVGGAAALALVAPIALQPYSGDERRRALLAVLRRFSRLATAALVIVVATGVYSAASWLYGPSDLVESPWGGALLIKLGMVGGLLLLGLLHHIAANPERFSRWSQRLDNPLLLAFTLRLEAAAALAILIGVANLSATPVPEPDFLDEQPPVPSAEQTLDDMTVAMTFSPGAPGVNTFDVLVTRAGQPVDDLEVRLQLANSARDWRSAWSDAEAVDAGLYVAANADIDREGRWLTLVDLKTREGAVHRAAFDWTLSSANTAREPGAFNLAALAGVLLALGWAAYPSALRLYRWLDWRPASVAAAAGAVVATIIFVVLGYVMIQQNEAAYEAALNPTPMIVNPLLPDENSLRLGQELYETQCAGWPEAAGRVMLVERLSRLRDEQLFTMIRDGANNLPACAFSLSDEARWNIVNFVRTLEKAP